MKKNLILWIIIFIMLIFNILLLYKSNNNNNVLSKDTNTTDTVHYNSLFIEELKEKILQQQKSEGIYCPEIYAKNIGSKNDVSLYSLIKNNTPTLCFRFKETDCDACISAITGQFQTMKTYFPENGITILCGYSNTRQFSAFAASLNFNCQVFNVNLLPIPLDEQSEPYFFILTDDKNIQNIFIPEEKDSEFTVKYLNVMRNKYWQK